MAPGSNCWHSSTTAWRERVSSQINTGVSARLALSTATRLCQKVSVATAAICEARSPAAASAPSILRATISTNKSASTLASPSPFLYYTHVTVVAMDIMKTTRASSLRICYDRQTAKGINAMQQEFYEQPPPSPGQQQQTMPRSMYVPTARRRSTLGNILYLLC